LGGVPDSGSYPGIDRRWLQPLFQSGTMKIFLIGFMGSGKTHWGKLLSEGLQLPFFDLDTVITTTEQKNISQIFSEFGEEFFRYKEKEVLEEIVSDHERFILSCGGGTPCFFNNIEFMKTNGKVIWLNTSVNTLKDRLFKERASRPLIKAIGDAELKNYIIRKLGDRKMYYEQADLIIPEESASLDSIIKSLLGS
jgi:shikimate kinase